jgi:hypothetical protein
MFDTSLTPGSLRCVLNLTERRPSGTSTSPSSGERPNEVMTRCFSFLRSELLRGELVFALSGFLNILLQKMSSNAYLVCWSSARIDVDDAPEVAVHH